MSSYISTQEKMRMLCMDIGTGRFIKTRKDRKVLKWSRCDAVVDDL